MRRVRRLRTALTVLAISFIVTTQAALAADPEPQSITPTGFGDLLPTPDLTHGDTRTLFEQFSPMAYGLDFEGSIKDPFRPVFNAFAQMLMLYIIAATRAAIAVGWWLFSFTDIQPLMDSAADAIGSTSTQLTGWLLPSALAFGAVAAYVQRRSNGTAFGQLVWVFAAGVVAISLAVGPATWLKGVDGARQVGAQTVMGASGEVVGETMKTPIEWPEPAFAGSARDTMLRKSGDAAWRGFAVTPWCIAEFGSLEACKRYGKGMLETGMDQDKRLDYIKEDVAKAEGGDDSPTVKWAKGENPFGRIGVLIVAAVAASLFAFLNIGLAVTALMAFIGCLIMLVVGVIFACLFIIPGRSRQWGMNWLEALLGLVLQSIAAMLVFGVALSMLTAVFGLSETLGWLPVTGLAVIVLIAAFRLRRLLETFTSLMRPGVGSMMMGSFARRGAVQAVRRVVSAIRGRGASPSVSERPKDRERSSSQEGGSRPDTTRVFRSMPVAGSGTRSPIGERDRSDNTGVGRGKQPAEVGTASSSIGRGGSRIERLVAQSRDRRGAGSIVGGTAAPSVGSPNGKVRDIYPGGSVDSPAAAARKESPPTDRSSGRHARRSSTAIQLRQGRYEPRQHVYSASLREGPPKAGKEVRRTPSGQQRRFREYSAARSSGPTNRAPGGR